MVDNLTDEELSEYLRTRYDKITAIKAEIKEATELQWKREREAQVQRKVESIDDDVKNAIIEAASAGAGGSALSPGGNV